MPSFSDSIFLFVLALLLFGPKRLPVLARELGKWVGEFRRASNEFKMQMEEELRLSEQADRQKQIAAIEAAAPIPPPLDEPEHPHLPSVTADDSSSDLSTDSTSASSTEWYGEASGVPDPGASEDSTPDPSQSNAPSATGTVPPTPAPRIPAETLDGVPVLPIATSGDLRMMPPSTGLPTARSAGNPLDGLLDAIPEARKIPATEAPAALSHTEPETAAHGH